MQVDLPDTGTMIFTSDAVYMGDSWGPPATPAAIVNDMEQFYSSVEKLRGIQEQTNATMVFGHDAEQIHQLRVAPRGRTHDVPDAQLTEETIFTWGAPPLKFGAGAADEIGFEMAGFGVRRVLIVTDPGVSAARRAAADRGQPARATTSSPRSSTACTSSRPTTR